MLGSDSTKTQKRQKRLRNQSLSDSSSKRSAIFHTRARFQLRRSKILFAAKHIYSTTNEQTIICRQLFAGHVVGSQPMKRKGKMHRMVKT